jgi:hypothetical protein
LKYALILYFPLDWIVDRGGQQVRYVIDYYSDESLLDKDQLPQHMRDIDSMQSIKVDVRPALDSHRAVIDRFLNMPIRQWFGSTEYHEPSFFPASTMVKAQQKREISLQKNWDTIQVTCKDAKDKVKNCKSDLDCAVATITLQKCIAGIVCPTVAADFDTCAKAVPEDLAKIEMAYGALKKCIETLEIDSTK